MSRSLLASASALVLIGTLGIGEAFSFEPGGGKLPGLEEAEVLIQLLIKQKQRLLIRF